MWLILRWILTSSLNLLVTQMEIRTFGTTHSSSGHMDFSHGHFNQELRCGNSRFSWQGWQTPPVLPNGIKRLESLPSSSWEKRLFSYALSFRDLKITFAVAYMCFCYFLLQAYLSSLHLALLYFTDVVFIYYFYKVKVRSSTSKKIMTCFIVILTSAQWSDANPTVSPRYVWIQ